MTDIWFVKDCGSTDRDPAAPLRQALTEQLDRRGYTITISDTPTGCAEIDRPHRVVVWPAAAALGQLARAVVALLTGIPTPGAGRQLSRGTGRGGCQMRKTAPAGPFPPRPRQRQQDPGTGQVIARQAIATPRRSAREGPR